jgi:urate oxidase
MRYEITYGKQHVPVYRVYAAPLTGVAPIPESTFTGRDNRLLAAEVDITVFGTDFLPAYTEGDNSMVVATDSMKNIIIEEALAFPGSTLEHYARHVGEIFIGRYGHIRDVAIEVRELPFPAVPVPDASGAIEPSDRLFAAGAGDATVVRLRLTEDGSGIALASHEVGRTDLKLLKITGSAFTRFVRDEHTTLPDRIDRPLYIYLDVFWTYRDVADGFDTATTRFVPGEQVRDLVAVTFHAFVSESIQHLVHEMGLRILERFPQLASVRFVAQNRTRDPFGAREDRPEVKVYSDPFPAWGEITLTLTQDDA